MSRGRSGATGLAGRGGGGILALLLLLSGEPARADPSGIPDPAGDDILVTASRRAEPTSTVPAKIDVATGARLEALRITNLRDLGEVVPGLALLDPDGRTPSVALRGIAYDPDTTAAPAVDIYWNETPLSDASAFRSLFDLDRIEVVRGPQGTLRGRSSPAGQLLITTRAPDLDGLGGFVSQEVADHDRQMSEAALNLPIVADHLALRVAGAWTRDDLDGVSDPINHETNRDLFHGGRASLVLVPDDRWRILLVHQAQNDRRGDLAPLEGVSPDGVSLKGSDAVALAEGPANTYNRSSLTTLAIDFTPGLISVAYLAGYQVLKDSSLRDIDYGNAVPGFSDTQFAVTDQQQWSQELRLFSEATRPVAWMVGAYLDQNRTSGLDRQLAPGSEVYASTIPEPPLAAISAVLPIQTVVRDFGAFTADRFRLDDDDEARVGARFQSRQSFQPGDLDLTLPNGAALPPLVTIPPDAQHLAGRAWTGDASLTHAFRPELTGYVTVARSWRPGGYALGIAAPLPDRLTRYQSETSQSAEIGVKARSNDGAFSVDADLFDQHYHNYILRRDLVYYAVPDVYGPGIPATGFANLNANGPATTDGAEVTLTAHPTPDFRLDVDGFLSDAHFDHARVPCNDYAGTGHPNQDGAPRVTGGDLVSYCQLSGNVSPVAPWSVTIDADYAMPLDRDGVTLDGRVLLAYQPSWHDALTAIGSDPVALVNLYASARTARRDWDLTLFVRNLLDRREAGVSTGRLYPETGTTVAGTPVSFDSGYSRAALIAGRQIGASLSYRFGGG